MSDTAPTPTPAPAKSGPFASFHHFITAAEDKLKQLFESRDAISRGVLEVDSEARAAVAIAVRFAGNNPVIQRMASVVNTVTELGDKAALAILKRDGQS
jgi:hypothetical protein